MTDAAKARRSIAVVFLVNGACMGAWASSIPAVKARLELSDTMLGMALLTMALGAILAMLLAGPINDRQGSRRASLASGVALAVLLPLPALAPSSWTLLAALFCLGMANGAMDVSMNAHGVAVEKTLGRPIMSSLHAFFSIGGIAAAACIGLAFLGGSTAGVNLIVAAVALLASLLLGGRDLLPSTADAVGSERKLALPYGPLLPAACMAFIALVCEGAMFDWAAVYLKEGLGAATGTAALGFGVFAGSMAAARLLGDRVVATLGREQVLRASALLALAGYALALGWPLLPTALAGYVLIGLGVANIVPILFAAGGSVPGIGSGTGVAAVATAGYGGALAGPAVIGLIAGQTSLRLALAVAAAFLLVIALRPLRQPEPAPAIASSAPGAQ